LLRGRQHVDRLRDDFLAGAGLAIDHDGRRGRRDLLDDRIDLAHLRVGADECAAAIGARRHDLYLFFARVELEQTLTDRDRAPGLQERFADAHLVDERAVRRVVVDEHVAVVVLDDLAVVARHRVVVEHDVVVFHRADADLFLVE
jgi:hypothetical protein